MEIEGIFDRNVSVFFNHPITRSPDHPILHSPRLTLMSTSRSALTASGFPGTVIVWPHRQVTTKPPSEDRSAAGIPRSLPSLMERSTDHRRSDPEIPSGVSVVLMAR